MALKIDQGTLIQPVARPTEEVETGQRILTTVPYLRQEQTNWCWAASIQMVLRHDGNNAVRQCDLATTLFGGACCSAPSSSVCNQGATPAQQVQVLSAYGRTGNNINGQASYSTIQLEIGANRPVTAGIHWNGGGGHRVVIRGWNDDNGQRIDVCDPLGGRGLIYYSDLQSGFGMGNWYGSMIGIH